MAGKNTFRLSLNSPDHYVSLFDEQKLTASSGIARMGLRQECATVVIPAGELEFDLFLPSANGRVTQVHIDTAKDVLRQIVSMDEQERPIEDIIDSDEILAWVWITDTHVDLHYFASTVNSEWDARFMRDPSGKWICQGIPKHGQH